jgi:hypothetical protein
MEKLTHVFKLTSGVECEVTELGGRQQRLLTEQGSKSHTEKLNEMLASIVVRVGSKTEITPSFIESMLSGDKKKILVEARQFSLGFQKQFELLYPYVDSNGVKQEETLNIPLEEGFPETSVKILDVDFEGKESLVPANYSEYSDVQVKYKTVLPRSKTLVELEHLTYKGEKWASSLGKKQRSSHTLIEMRFPVYFKKTENDEVKIKLNLDDLSLQDIEHLRKVIKAMEGEVGTEVMFEHPEAAIKGEADKYVKLDVLSTVGFFFPSGAI